MVSRIVLLAGLTFAFASVTCLAADPSGYGQGGGEFDIKLSRVPSSELAAAKALKPPFEATPEVLAEGKGDGGAAKVLPIQPRNFTNPKFKKYRTPGEMMWVLKNGSLGQSGKVPGTGMLPIVGQFLSEDDGWKVLLYELSLGQQQAE